MRLKNRYVAVLAVLTLFIAGCSNNLVGRMSGDGSAESNVTFSVTDIPPNYAKLIKEAQNPASRSILPNAPLTSGLTFFLKGTSNTGGTLPETPVSVDSSTHKFNITLSARVWDLTLIAYKDYNSSTPPHKPVLMGHCTVDVTNSNGTATFAMSTKGLTTPGTVKVTGSVLDPLNICTKYTINICDAYSGNPITQYKALTGASEPTNAEQSYPVGPHSGSFDFHYGDTTISSPDPAVTLNPGAYKFLMVFYKGDGTPGNQYVPIGHYMDMVVIDPGNVSEKTFSNLDVLNKAPTKPDNLRAYRVKNSEDTVGGGYYLSKLTWDSSMFETNYELELSSYPDDGTTSTPPVKTVYGFNTTNNAATNFAGSPVRYDGSLVSGSHECILKLELGKVYEVRLCARNYIGASDWIERVSAAAATPPDPNEYELIDAGGAKHINRRRIRYHLNGGTLTLNKGGPGQQIKTGIHVTYESYQGTGQDLLKIEPSSSTNGNTLVKGPTDFSGWLNPNTGATVTHDHTASSIPAAHTDFYKHINVDLATDFGNGLEGTVTPPSPITDIDANKIKITYKKQDGSSPCNPIMSGTHLVIPKRIGTDISFIKVEFDNLTSADEYTDMKCTASFTSNNSIGVSEVTFISAPDGKSCKFSTATYPTQTFVLRVSARNTSHELRSRTFLIDLQN